MGKIGIGDRLNANSKKNIIFAKDYRKVRRPAYTDSVGK